MNTKHTPTPWQQTYGAQRDPVCTWPIATAVGNEPSEFYIHGMNEKYGTVDNEANAARIVQCVNACAGIADPAAALASVRQLLKAWLRDIECPEDCEEIRKILDMIGTTP